MDKQKELGKKIRYFRERARLSQFDLEMELDASPGSISRIENGRVNPTKETILKISEVLKLKQNEKADLLNVIPLFPSQEDIDSAIKEVGDYFNKDGVIAYMYDDWWILRAASKDLPKILNLTPEVVKKVVGKNLLEMYFDPKLGVRGLLDTDHFKESLAIEIARA